MKRRIRLNESQLRKMVSESVKRVLREQKQTISSEQAERMLMSYIERNDFQDRAYEFAQDLCNQAINDIESKYTIVDANGEQWTDDEEIVWYDDIRDDFIKAVFEKLKLGCF